MSKQQAFAQGVIDALGGRARGMGPFHYTHWLYEHYWNGVKSVQPQRGL